MFVLPPLFGFQNKSTTENNTNPNINSIKTTNGKPGDLSNKDVFVLNTDVTIKDIKDIKEITLNSIDLSKQIEDDVLKMNAEKQQKEMLKLNKTVNERNEHEHLFPDNLDSKSNLVDVSYTELDTKLLKHIPSLPNNIEIMNLVRHLDQPTEYIVAQSKFVQPNSDDSDITADSLPVPMAQVDINNIEKVIEDFDEEIFFFPAGHGLRFSFKLKDLYTSKNEFEILENIEI